MDPETTSQIIKDSKKADTKYNRASGINGKRINELWRTQGGKCYYCDTKMTHGSANRKEDGNGLSLDRVNESKGHTNKNGVLACMDCNNGGKGKSFAWKLEHSKKTKARTHKYCPRCGEVKGTVSFNKDKHKTRYGLAGVCRDCSKE